MDLKKVFEETGYKVKENRFLKAPKAPYIVFYDDQLHRGADATKSIIVEHNVEVELYVETIEDKSTLLKLECTIDNLSVDYRRSIDWMDEESQFKVLYTFGYVEKKKKGGI